MAFLKILHGRPGFKARVHSLSYSHTSHTSLGYKTTQIYSGCVVLLLTGRTFFKVRKWANGVDFRLVHRCAATTCSFVGVCKTRGRNV
jgi:hypothetical protein